MPHAANGWKGVLIGILSTAVIIMGGSMATIGAGKASKEDVDELQDRDVEQQVLNAEIKLRLGNLETGLVELNTKMDKLPKAVADELRKP